MLPPIRIKFRIAFGKEFSIKIAANASIQDLKIAAIAHLDEKVGPQQMRILFQGKLLKDHFRVNSPYEISDGDTVQAVVTRKTN